MVNVLDSSRYPYPKTWPNDVMGAKVEQGTVTSYHEDDLSAVPRIMVKGDVSTIIWRL